MFDSLDFRFYFNSLATVLCNYIVIEDNPLIADYINGTYSDLHPELSDKEIETEMATIIKKTKDSLTHKYVMKYFPHKPTFREIKSKTNVDQKYSLPDMNKLLKLEQSIVNIINKPPEMWAEMLGMPDKLMNLLNNRIGLCKQNSLINNEVAMELLEMYEQLKLYVNKKYNTDNSSNTFILMKDATLKSHQKFVLYMNPSTASMNKFKKIPNNIIFWKTYGGELFSSINELMKYLLTILMGNQIEIIQNAATVKNTSFKCLHNDFRETVRLIRLGISIIEQ